MKFITSKKKIKDNYGTIIGIDYCEADYLLRYRTPFACTIDKDGNWLCDYYDIDGVCISTGYDPIPARRAVADYDTIRKYDSEARKIWCERSPLNLTVSKISRKEKQTNKLLERFVTKAVDDYIGNGEAKTKVG